MACAVLYDGRVVVQPGAGGAGLLFPKMIHFMSAIPISVLTAAKAVRLIF